MILLNKTTAMLTAVLRMICAVLLVFVLDALAMATSGNLRIAFFALWVASASAVVVLGVVAWHRMFDVRRLTRAEEAKLK